MDLIELRSLCRCYWSGEVPQVPPIFVGGTADVDPAVHWMADYFGADESRTVLRVRILNEPSRFLARQELLPALASRPGRNDVDDEGHYSLFPYPELMPVL